jgi:predicted Zn-dependent protease
VPPNTLENLEKLLEGGRDNALLRYSLGNEYLKAGAPDMAIPHLERALAFDPAYSAAWKLLGAALTANNRLPDALQAYRRGIEVAEARGDIQAAREMKVFVKRIVRQLS